MFAKLATISCVSRLNLQSVPYNGSVSTSPFRRFTTYTVPLLLWMVVIFCASTRIGSGNNTETVLFDIRDLLPFLRPYLTPAVMDIIHHIIRKSAHITEYAILAVLAYRAIRQDRAGFRDIQVWGPILLCIVYASTDEYHQRFVPTRGPSVEDVLFDTFGGMVGTVGCLWRFVRTHFPPDRIERQ